ncbi:MAG: type II toxin-antitoxin system VapC family toxin [Actinobacteria bacterium]|nr:type II toxin-antitoxin system VapC family toxin [Actinomycetota bacterium]
MRLLLDTNVLLNWLEGRRLSHDAAQAITDSANDAFVSVATVWEMGIKYAVGKLSVPPPSEDTLDALGFSVLGIRVGDAQRLAELPLQHRDPFDRMLVAQALGESLTLVTRDRTLAAYGVAVITA